MNALSIPTKASTKSLAPLLGVLLALLISALDKAMATAAMPRAAAELGGFSRYPWTTTAHLLTSTIAMLVIAKLSDLYGRRRLYLWSTLILVLGSILCGAAGRFQVPIDGMNQLIFSRGILGIGDGGITALAFTFIADLFAPSKRGRYQGVLSAVYGFGSVVGLTLGGWITDHWSWRWAFWVTVPIGAAAIFTILGTVPNSQKNVQRGSIDWAGIVTLCGWLVPLLMAFGNAGSGNWLLASGALMIVIFLLVEGRAQEPLVFLDLFRNRKVALTSVNLFLQGIAVFAVIVFLPVSLQGGRGTTAATSGLALSCVIAGIFSGNLAAGQLLSRTGRYRLIATLGTGCATIGLMLFSRIGVGTSAKGLFVAAIVCGLGFGSLTPTYEVLVQNATEAGKMGVATGSTRFFYSIGSTIGPAVLGGVLTGVYRSRLDAGIPSDTPATLKSLLGDPLKLFLTRPNLDGAVSGVRDGKLVLERALQTAQGGLLTAVHVVFSITAVVMLASFLLNLFLENDASIRMRGLKPADL